MTNHIRLFATAFIALLCASFFAAAATPASAQQPFKVSVSAASAANAPGSDAALLVRIEGQTASLPSFIYTVEGGTLAGVLPPTPTAANVAQGTVFVSRDTAGTARVTVSFGGQDLASGEARFVGNGRIEVRATLNAGPDAAARTWRYEVLNGAGAVVATVSLGTSGDDPTASASTIDLPHGAYTVRQVLGSDTATACAAGTFYEVAAPAGAATAVELASDTRTVDFTIRPCPDLPSDLQVLIPVDTIAPGFGPGIVGDPDALVPPGQTPISEVAGARQPGNIPFPPNTGDSALAAVSPEAFPVLLLASGLVAVSLSLLGWSLRERGRAGGR